MRATASERRATDATTARWGWRLLCLTIAAVCAAIVAGCGSSESETSSGGRASDDKLVVATWKGYGADQPWAVKQFEAQTGAKVVFQYYNSPFQMLQLLREGGRGKIDVVLPNLQFVAPAVEAGLLEPIDTTRLKAYDELYPRLRNHDALQRDGKIYGVPWVWGANVLFYNSAKVDDPPASWTDLWSNAYSGKVGWVDAPNISVIIGALHLGQDPYKPDLPEVESALVDLKRNIKVNYAAADDFRKAYLNGSITVGQTWSTEAGRFPDLVTVSPTDGPIGWQDNWSIVKDAPHESLAYKWIDFMTGADFEKRWALEEGAGSPAPANSKAAEALPKKVAQRTGSDLSLLDSLVMLEPVPQQELTQWQRTWESVKAN